MHQFKMNLIKFDIAIISATISKIIAFINIMPMNINSTVFDHLLLVVRCAREMIAIQYMTSFMISHIWSLTLWKHLE